MFPAVAHGLLIAASGGYQMGNSLKEFMDAFLKQHALTTEGEMVLDVSPEELEELGLFFVQGMCGWALGLQMERQRRRLVEVTDQIERRREPAEFGFDDDGDDKDDEDLIH
jgi:hypothetical protein